MIKLGIFLARMQPIHNAHIFMVQEALKKCERVCIVLGSENKKDMLRNPYDIVLREKMLRECFDTVDNDKLTIFTLPDWSQEGDILQAKEWGSYLYYNIVSRMEAKEFTFFYSDDPSIMRNWFTDSLLERVSFEFYERTNLFLGLSATKIRQAFIDSDVDYIRNFCPLSVFLRFDELKKCYETVLENPKEDFSMN